MLYRGVLIISKEDSDITGGTTHKRNKVLMVPYNTVLVSTAQLEKNVIKVATKQHSILNLY